MIGTGIEAYNLQTAPYTKTVKVISGTSHTLEAGDANHVLHFINAGNIKLFIPAGLPEDLKFEGKQIGGGSVNISPAVDSGVSIRTNLSEAAVTTEAYSVFFIDWISDNEYTAHILDSDPSKPNKDKNTEYENLADTTDVYSLSMFSRIGAFFKSTVKWNALTQKLTIPGTQAIWEAVQGVTSGNMGIRALAGALESMKVFDAFGNFWSTGTEGGKRVVRIFTELRLVNGIAYNATEYKAVECPASVTTLLKAIPVPNNSIVTVDILNVAIANTDMDSITGSAQFAFRNVAGVVTEIAHPSAFKYDRQFSTIKAVDGVVINTDTRIDASIVGTTANINFVNTVAKIANVHCEIKYNTSLQPVA